jgi:hypothetical protein
MEVHMNGSVADSVGPSARYTILAANVSKTLNAVQSRQLTDVEQRLMERAADLLLNIVQGSQFVEQRNAHALSNPSENLFTVSHALAALHTLGERGEVPEQVTNTFEDLEKDLRKLAHGEKPSMERLLMIGRFFDALRSFFYRDVADFSVGRGELIFEKPAK